MPGTLLQLTNVSKSFGAVRALRGASFSLEAGEVHALLGENGAGKSTLIKLMTGAHQPDDGQLEIGGRAVQRLNPAAAHALGVAAIYQQPALFPELSVAENIALGLEKPRPLRRVRWALRRRRATELMQTIGAHIDPDIAVRELSMPHQQLVEIARALGAGARIMIMDEPTSSLTETEVALLFRAIRDLRTHGVGVIYISHRLDEVFSVADRVTVLRDGESVGTYRIQELNEAQLIRLMIGRDASAVFPAASARVGGVVLTLRGVGCKSSGVHDVSFDVCAGEIVGLAGLVGAGRTELARILFGITPADRGELVLNGQAVQIRSPRQAIDYGIGYVPEDRRRHGVILEMSIAANISMAVHPTLFPWTWVRRADEQSLADRYIRELSVKAPSRDAVAASLSGGNQQRVALARWLAANPKLLILDEPTQGVDVGAKVEIHNLMRRLTSEGLAVLMISSDLPEVLGMSNRIAVMREGTVTALFDGAHVTAQQVMAAALGQSIQTGAA